MHSVGLPISIKLALFLIIYLFEILPSSNYVSITQHVFYLQIEGKREEQLETLSKGKTEYFRSITVKGYRAFIIIREMGFVFLYPMKIYLK